MLNLMNVEYRFTDDRGIPIDYKIHEYTCEDQLKELEILSVHECESSDDGREDIEASNLDSLQSFKFEDDRSDTSRTPGLYELSDSERTISSQNSHSVVSSHSYSRRELQNKYDRMKPLIFGMTSTKPKRGAMFPPKPKTQLNNHGSINSLNSPSPHSSESDFRKRNILHSQNNGNGDHNKFSDNQEYKMHSQQITKDFLFTETAVKQYLSKNVGSNNGNYAIYDDGKDEKKAALSPPLIVKKLTQSPSPRLLESDEMTFQMSSDKNNKFVGLIRDVWWMIDGDSELKTYKADDEYRIDMLTLLESFKHNAKISHTFAKLLAPSILDYASKKSTLFVSNKQWKHAIRCYDAIIHYSKILGIGKVHSYILQRGQCHLKMCSYQKALSDAEQSYKMNKTFEKGYLMHARILMKLHQYQSAKGIYKLGSELPNAKSHKSFVNGMHKATKHLNMIELSKNVDVLHLELQGTEETKENKSVDSMSDDNEQYMRDRKKMTTQIQVEIDTECLKWKKLIDGKDSHIIYIEAIKNCKNINKCACTKRVVFLMQLYLRWCNKYIEYMSLNKFIQHLDSYFTDNDRAMESFLLVNDYVHIIDKHLSINNQEKKQLNWKYLTTELGFCDNDYCKMFRRHFRNKNICGSSLNLRAQTYMGYVNSDYVSLIQLFDQIHSHFTHCNPFCMDSLYDSVFKIYVKGDHIDYETDSVSDNDDVFFDDDADDDDVGVGDSDDDDDDERLQLLNKKKQKKQNKLRKKELNKIKQYGIENNLCLQSRFVSHFDEKLGMQFGVQFVYWDYFSESPIYCKPKYETLKSEMLHNSIYPINKYVWNDVLNKAKWIQNSYKCKSEMIAKNLAFENRKFGIVSGLKISISHIMVLLFMSNYIELRNKFIHKGCNPIAMDEEMSEIKIRNSEIGNFCKLLYESILFFGNEMKSAQYFYHAIDDKLLFNNYNLAFKAPISTSLSLDCISNIVSQSSVYNSKECIILQWGPIDSYGCPYFDVSWMSDCPFEQEALLFNCKLGLYDIHFFDIDYGDQTKHILQSNFNYVRSLILFEKISRSCYLSDHHLNNSKNMLFEKICVKMIENYMKTTTNASAQMQINQSQNNNKNIIAKLIGNNSKNKALWDEIEIPVYIQELFEYFVENVGEVWLIKSELAQLSDALRNYFLSDFANNTYGAFLRTIESNVLPKNNKLCIHFLNEYVWYISKKDFLQFLSLKCDQCMEGPPIYCPISYNNEESDSDDSKGNNHDHNGNSNNENGDKYNNDSIVFTPNCFRSVKSAPTFGAFGLSVKSLPPNIEKIKFEYQVYCQEANYTLLVPAKKWMKQNDEISFKSFKSEIVTSNHCKEFSYRYTVKIVNIRKTQELSPVSLLE